MHRTITHITSGVAFLGCLALAAVASNSQFASSSKSFADERSGRMSDFERIDFGQVAQCASEIPGLPIATCFSPDASAETRAQVLQMMIDAWYAENGAEGGTSFELGNRWSLNGSSTQGTPVVIKWSLVPDGVFVQNAGLGSGNNAVNAKMASTFGSVENGLVVFRLVFQRWADLTGTSYSEVSDDGAAYGSSGGASRGDVRIFGIPFSTNDVLAYNFFPGSGTGGDMVINTGMGWGPSTNNWRYLRNIMMHEHGHGIGLDHVCPANSTKLMEPFISVNFDGPQHDDIRGGQRHYGDNYEPNDSAGTSLLISDTDGTTLVTGLSIDDNGDSDWIRFFGTAGMTATVRATPLGMTYSAGPETQACNSGGSINSLSIQDLQIQLYRNGGATLLVTQNAASAGFMEQILDYDVTTNETYYARISTASGADNIQTYTLTVILTPGVIGDLNGDGFVDGADLGILLGNWGSNGLGDLNNDGVVDGADLGLLLGNWS